jgi:Flp pilus assembly protein TadG
MNITVRRENRGQSLVEWALVLPILILIVVVVFDVGRGVYYYSAVHNAAREGARYGIVQPDDTTGIEAAARRLAVGMDSSMLTITTTQPDTKTIRVQVSYNFIPITPLAASVVGSNSVTLNSRSTMRIEK